MSNKKRGLTQCTPDEFALIQKLNADYNAKFGWPFILAVRGPRGVGLTKRQIIDTFQRRVHGHPDFELAECIRNIHRIAEIRLNDKFGFEPTVGQDVWDWQEQLARHTDPGYAELGQLTVTYLTDAHRACAADISQWMRDCGFDDVQLDAVGNVVGLYKGSDPTAKTLLTGSHYDTVRNGGKYDGRLGIFVPMACVRELHRQGKRLPFGIEVVAFAEEEGQRYKATFLGSGALTGSFNPDWLDQLDADGISMRQAMQHAGLPATLESIAAVRRDPTRYLGFVEVHIEQGPVLNELNLPMGVVTSINGSVRYLGEVTGQASHAGTTPMPRRRDAACAVAELALYLEDPRRPGRRQCGHHGPTERAQRQHQRGARCLPLQPGHSCSQRCPAQCSRGRRATKNARHLHPPGPELQAGRNHARQRCAQRRRPASPLDRCRASHRPAGVQHAQRRGPRRHEAARRDAPGHAVCARRKQRHQPQPA
jgi:N-carbamoyl-L-amino-acid hydrolase